MNSVDINSEISNSDIMSIEKFIGLLCFITFSVVEAYGIDKEESLYRILKIKTSGDYYVIHAQRNDSLFKIVSKKETVVKSDLEVLRKGKYYSFVFGNKDNEKPEGEPLAGLAGHLHVQNSRFWGDTRIKFSKRFHYRLYTTRNLIGLYYSPPIDK